MLSSLSRRSTWIVLSLCVLAGTATAQNPKSKAQIPNEKANPPVRASAKVEGQKAQSVQTTEEHPGSASKPQEAGPDAVPENQQSTTNNQQSSVLPDTIVTATRTAGTRAESAASLDVVDKADLDQRQISNVADALRNVPGLNVVQNGTPGPATSLFTRGTESNHTNMLLSGRRLHNGLLGGFNFGNFNVNNLSRIEVWRGPSSSLYGNDGIGGVINMIAEDGRGVEGVHGSAFFEAGSYNSFREGAQVYGSEGPFNFAVSGSRLDADFQRPNNEYRLSNITATFGVQATRDVYVDVLVDYSLSDGGSPGDLRFGPNLNNNLIFENWLVSPQVTWQTTEWWEQKAFVSFAPQRTVAEEPDFFNNEIDRLQNDQIEVDYQNTFQIAENWKIVAGFNALDYDVKRNSSGFFPPDPIDQNLSSQSFFAQNQWEALPGLHFIQSIRADHYAEFGNPITWRAGASYEIPKAETLVHFSYGTSYAAPTPGDLYFPPLFGFPSANPNLVPEESEGWEFGVEQPLWDKRVVLRSTYFQNTIKDLISLDPFFVPANIAEGKTEGVENSIEFKPLDNLRVNIQHTYLTAENTATDKRLIRRPRNTFGADVVYLPVPAVTLSSGFSYVNGREDGANLDIEDYFTMRVAVAWQIQQNVSVFGRVENLTNDQYAETFGFPALDTQLYAGVKVSF